MVWTGDDDASVHFADGADRVVDLAGRLVTPAFVDARYGLKPRLGAGYAILRP